MGRYDDLFPELSEGEQAPSTSLKLQETPSSGGRYDDLFPELTKSGKTQISQKPSKLKRAWSVVDFILQAPEYGLVGGAESLGRGEYNPMKIIESAAKNLETRKTLPQALIDAGYSKKIAYGVGLPASFFIPGIPIGKGAGLLGKGAKTVGITEKVAPVAKKLSPALHKLIDPFIYRGGQPTKYAEKAEEALLESKRGKELAVETAKKLTKDLSRAEQIRIGQIIKGGISISPREEKIRKIASEARGVLDKKSQELLDEAMKGIETKYTPTGLVSSLTNLLQKSYKKPIKGLGEVEVGFKTPQNIADYLLSVFKEKMPAKITSKSIGMGTKLITKLGKPTVKIVKEQFRQGGVKGLKTKEIPGVSYPATTITEDILKSGGPGLRTKLGKVAEGLPEIPEKKVILPVEKFKTEAISGGVKMTDQLQKTIEANLGRYMPRLYRQFEKDPEGTVKILNSSKGKMILDNLKKRKDIPDEIRRDLGEILEPAYPVGKGIARISDIVAKSKLFRFVNDNFAQIEKTTGDLVQLPDVKTLGILAGKYVPKSIADDLVPMVIKGKSLIPEFITKTYDKALSLWKVGKILLNPATRVRNQLSNLMLMDYIGGMPVWNPFNYGKWVEAGREYLTKGEFYKLVKTRTNLLGNTFYGNELAPFLDSFAKETSQNLLSRFVNTMKKGIGGSYNAQEEWAKLTLAKYWYDKGKSIEEAAKIAEDALFNYSKIPPIIKALRNLPFGYPFITFSYFAVPRTIKAFVKSPTKIAKYTRSRKAIEQEAEAKYGEFDKENLPEYMQNRQFLRLPIKHKGQDLFLDLNYILPWGDLGEAGGASLEPSNPAYRLVADLSRNKSSFTQSEIWDSITDMDRNGEINQNGMRKIGEYIWKTLMPSFTPPIPGVTTPEGREGGGYSYDKLVSALKGRPDYFGRLRDVPITLLDTLLGLKMTPVDVEKERMFKQIEKSTKVKKTINKIRSIYRNQGMSDVEKEKAVERLRNQLRDIGQSKERVIEEEEEE